MLDQKTILAIAKLARLKLTPEERERFRGELSRVIDFVEQLKTVNTEGVDPTAHASGLENVLAGDVVTPSQVSPQELLKAAPDKENGLLRVKVVLEEK